jgi:hypothetical protein
MKRVLRAFALLLLGVVLGLPLGIYLVQHKFIDKEKALGMANEEAFVDGYAKKQFIYADPQTAREALTYAVKTHEEMQGKSTLSGWPEKADLGWCYAELSLIEESSGNATLAGDYMSHAQRVLKELGLKDSSESHIRELLRPRPVSHLRPSVQSR